MTPPAAITMATTMLLLQSARVASQTYLSCEHARVAGVTSNAVVSIDPDGDGAQTSFRAYCNQEQHGGGWMLVATRGRNWPSDSVGSYGTDLTNPTTGGRDNIFKQPWSRLNFVTAWVQLADYNANFYLDGFNTVAERNFLGQSFFHRRGSTGNTGQKNCRAFPRGTLGNPYSGGRIVTNCGTQDHHVVGPVHDPLVGWCWWSYDYHGAQGTGQCRGQSFDFNGRGRMWVKPATITSPPTAHPTEHPSSSAPTAAPTIAPSTPPPTPSPTSAPTTSAPTSMTPTTAPTPRPTATPITSTPTTHYPTHLQVTCGPGTTLDQSPDGAVCTMPAPASFCGPGTTLVGSVCAPDCADLRRRGVPCPQCGDSDTDGTAVARQPPGPAVEASASGGDDAQSSLVIVIVVAVVVFGVGVGGTVYYYERGKVSDAQGHALARPGIQNALYDAPGAKTDGFGFAASTGAEDAGGYLEIDGTQTQTK